MFLFLLFNYTERSLIKHQNPDKQWNVDYVQRKQAFDSSMYLDSLRRCLLQILVVLIKSYFFDF